MTAKRKRPKVRYVVRLDGATPDGFFVFRVDEHDRIRKEMCRVADWNVAKRIAAALNLYESVRRGEL